MSETKKATVWGELRKPFPKGAVGLLPKVNCYSCTQATKSARSALDKHCDHHRMIKCADCGAYITEGHIHLDYVGHAVVTDRLNSVVGPDNWSLEPRAFDEAGNPKTDEAGQLWCNLTILDATKICVGDNATSGKELLGDALRNGAMRFGVALDLWTKDELESTIDAPELKNDKPSEVKVAQTAPKQPWRNPHAAKPGAMSAKTDTTPPNDPFLDDADVPPYLQATTKTVSAERIHGTTITRLGGALQLKGIVDQAMRKDILDAIAVKEYDSFGFMDMSEEGAQTLLKKLSSPTITQASLLALIPPVN